MSIIIYKFSAIIIYTFRPIFIPKIIYTSKANYNIEKVDLNAL